MIQDEQGNMTKQKIVLGPHRVMPGRLSVSRTIGDIGSKLPKYGGKEGVTIAQPEVSQLGIKSE
jgi:protein phosphatase PTC2/3